MPIQEPNKIILFDGICNLCSGFARFVIKRDKKGVFKFASIQSEIGEILLKEINFPVKPLTSIIYIHGSQYYSESTAVLKIFRELNGLWRFSYVFIAIPTPVRDIIYRFVARNRYKIFGKRKSCYVPTASLKERFLE
jgi:predicted DCC family thiol-disulfide oxidoreductase YuxK